MWKAWAIIQIEEESNKSLSLAQSNKVRDSAIFQFFEIKYIL